MPFDPDDLNKKNNSGKGQNKSGEDFINSSFAVQFKPGDKSNSVSDKLKEGNSVKDDFDSFKDEFDDFEIDDTISAFKPIGQKETPKEEPKAEPVKAEPAKKEEASIPAFPKDGGTFDRKPSDNVSKGPDKSNTPVFGSDKGQSRPAASQKKDEKLFNSGKDLDYATSEHDKDKSPFANAERPSAKKADKKPEVKTYGTVSSGVNAFSSANILDDIPEVGAEEKAAPSPFVIRPTPSPKPAMPKAAETAHHAPKAPAEHTAPASAKAAEKNERPGHTAPAAAKAAQNEKAAPAHTAPAAAKAAEKNERPGHTAPAAAKAAAKNEKPSASAHTAPASAKAEQKEKSAPAHTAPASAKAAEKSEKQAPAASANKPTSGQRPGEAAKSFTAPTFSRPAPTGAAIESIRPEDPRRMLAVEKSQKTTSTSTHTRTSISPVDTVKKTKKKKVAKAPKDPGIGGIITLGVIIVAFVGILLILQNIDKIGQVFGRKPVETLPTIQTTTTATVTETTTAATETTTEATTESTTEATTEETTTEATTVETTTEVTTAATTQATSQTTAKKAVNYGIATSKFSAKVTNFRNTSGGFKYDVVMVNKSGKTASFRKSLKSVSLSLLTEPAIKSMSSSSLSFKAKNGQWVGTPKRDFSIKPGKKVTITVTVKTYGYAQYYAYRAVNFKYN